MSGRTAAAAFVVIALASGLSGQSPGGSERTVLVTSDGALHLQVWHSGAIGLEKVWEARPRSADAEWQARRNEAITAGRDAPPAIADVNGDGANELVAIDAFGLTVYGRTPAYHAFATTADAVSDFSFSIGDVDSDGASEIVTQHRAGSGPGVVREIEVLKLGPAGLRSEWKQTLPGFGYGLAIEDVDGDRQKEIVTAADVISILKRRTGASWDVVAEVPNIGPVSLLRAGDVDKDGKNELVASGSSGKVTIYKHRKQGQRESYPVLWQSRYLAAEGLKASSSGGPVAVTQALAVGDVNGDQLADIVVGTFEAGQLGEREIRGTRLHVYRLDDRRDFVSDWVSDATPYQSISTLAIGDVDGDGGNEFVVNGRDVYKRDAASRTYRVVASACQACTAGVVGTLGELAEPVAATRVVPLYWNLQNRQIAEGQTIDVRLTLLNVWAEAKDVTVTVTSANPRLTVANGTLRVPVIAPATSVTTAAFRLTANAGKEVGSLRVEVTTPSGSRQSASSPIYVGPPLPTYQPDAESRLAEAVAQARDENRRVLIQWGSGADKASQDLILATRTSAVARTLLYEYEVVRAEMKGNGRLTAKYRVSAKAGLPSFSVIDAQGKLLANQPAAQFKAAGEGAAAYDGTKLDAFLKKHQAAYVNAEPLLTAALSQAKKDQKTLFLWFSAPW